MDINNRFLLLWGFYRTATANTWIKITPPISCNMKSMVCSVLDANAGYAVSRAEGLIQLYTTRSTNLEWVVVGYS